MKYSMKLGVFWAAIIAPCAFWMSPSLASVIVTVLRPSEVPLGISIDSDGTVVAEGAVVLQKAGTTIFVRQDWSGAQLRITVVTGPDTVVTKRFGGGAAVSDISIGHFLTVTGDLVASSDSLMIKAKSVKDWSLQSEAATFSGTIKSIASESGEITIRTGEGLDITLKAPEAKITKGKLSLSLDNLKIGDRIVRAEGAFDVPKKTLLTSVMEIYQDKTVFMPRNYQGILRDISSTDLPTVLTIETEGKTYRVHVPEGSTIWNTIRKNVSLSRFLKGDTVRFYGAVRDTDLSAIDAEIVRNISL